MKGQLKMFETLGVLVVFFFLLTAGFAFYFQAQKSAIGKDIEEANQQNAFNTALKAMYLPEFDCSFLVTQKENCIDELKAESFSELVEENSAAAEFYFQEFGDSKLILSEVYPSASRLVLYDSKPLVEGPQQQISTQTPILIYKSESDEYAFGILEVLRYV